jgi:hypothetical protein
VETLTERVLIGRLQAPESRGEAVQAPEQVANAPQVPTARELERDRIEVEQQVLELKEFIDSGIGIQVFPRDVVGSFVINGWAGTQIVV